MGGVDLSDPERELTRLLDSAVSSGQTPGLAFLVGRGGDEVFKHCAGMTAHSGAPVRPITPDTRFDLASLTKVVATTTFALMLAQSGRLALDKAVTRYLGGPFTSGWEQIRLWHLLTHSSGLPATWSFWRELDDPKARLPALCRISLRNVPGTEIVYSDLGFLVLGAVLESISGSSLAAVLQRELWEPLSLDATTFGPLDPLRWSVAATEIQPDGSALAGVVHDENARFAGGVCGHAGLFSTLTDLGRFARFWVGEGEGPLSRSWLARAAQPQFRAHGRCRGLGWVCRNDPFDFLGPGWPLTAVSHTGFTGTSVALDSPSRSFAVLLTNAVHCGRQREPIRELRRAAHEHAAALLFPT